MREIAEFVATDEGKEFYRHWYKVYKNSGIDPELRLSHARADVFREIEFHLGVDTGVERWVLEDEFTLNMFRGKNVNKIQEKLERLV